MRVFSNTAMSTDGKIGTYRHDHVAIGSDEDRRMMSVIRAEADAVLVGGKTFRNWPYPLIEKPEHLDVPKHRSKPVVNAVLSRTGILQAEDRRFPDPRVKLLVLGPPTLDVLAHEERFGAEVVTTAEPTVAWALDVLQQRGCTSTLIEGGGDFIFRAIAADRLDEIYLTLAPVIVGGASAPTLADGEGFEPETIRRLALSGLRRVGDELYLHYHLKK
ncbi:MAG: dihydrofolate reductase family protein [Myxococcota bacterium]